MSRLGPVSAVLGIAGVLLLLGWFITALAPDWAWLAIGMVLLALALDFVRLRR